MSRLLLLGLLAAAVAGQQPSSCLPAAKGVVTSTFVDKVKDTVVPVGIAALSRWQSGGRPIVQKHGLKIDNLREITAEHYKVDLSLAEKGSGATGGEVDLHVKTDVSAMIDVTVPLCHSTLRFAVRGIDVTVRASFDLTADSGLSIDILQLDATIATLDSFSGGCGISAVENFIHSVGMDFISGIVKNLVQNAVRKNKDHLEQLVNSALENLSWQKPLPLPAPFDKALFDFHLCDAKVRGSGSDAVLEVGIKGEVRDADFPSVVPPIPKPNLPETTGSHDVDFILGNYTADTLFYTYFQQGVLSLNVHRSDLPEGPLQNLLNTDFFEVLLPTLWAQHKHANMTLVLNVSSLPNATISPDKLQAQAGLDFGFFVEQPDADPLPAFTLTCNAVVSGSAFVNDTHPSPVKVAGEVDSVTGCAMEVKDVSCFGCKPGVELISSVERQVNNLLEQKLIPQLNDFLHTGVEIPLIELTDSGKVIDIAFSNGLIDEETDFGEMALDIAFSIRDQVSSAEVIANDSPTTLVV